MWMTSTSCPDSRVASSTARAKAAARLSRMQRTIAGRDAGTGRSASDSREAIRAGMSPGARKTASSGSKTGPPAGRCPAASTSGREADRIAARLPGPDRFLEQPEAHDVAQVADPPVDAELVREVREPTGLGQDRRVELHADERPRPARDERRAVVRRRRRRRSRGGVVRADVARPGCPAAARSRRRRRQRASRAARPGWAIGGKMRPRQPELLDQVRRPVARVDIEEPGRGRICRLRLDDARSAGTR